MGGNPVLWQGLKARQVRGLAWPETGKTMDIKFTWTWCVAAKSHRQAREVSWVSRA